MTDQPMGIKSLSEVNKEQYGKKLREIIKQIFTWDWIFSKWYEKIIVISSLLWGIISIFRWIF